MVGLKPLKKLMHSQPTFIPQLRGGAKIQRGRVNKTELGKILLIKKGKKEKSGTVSFWLSWRLDVLVQALFSPLTAYLESDSNEKEFKLFTVEVFSGKILWLMMVFCQDFRRLWKKKNKNRKKIEWRFIELLVAFRFCQIPPRTKGEGGICVN